MSDSSRPSQTDLGDNHSPEVPETPSFFREFQESRRLLFNTWGPILLLTVFSFGLAWMFVKPAPPKHMKIAAGPRDGAYFKYATAYAELFSKNGFDLEVVETAGSIENYQLLLADNDIHLAIVQGGTKPDSLPKEALEAIASLYFEPLWIFHRAETPGEELQGLAGKTVGIGPVDSGTHAIMELLLTTSGLMPPTAEEAGNTAQEASPPTEEDLSPIQPVAVGGQKAADLLIAGELEAASFVLPPTHPLILRLMKEPALQLLKLDRLEAYAQLYPYLSHVTLYEGVLDLDRNLPETDVPLLAPCANLISSPDLHDAFVPLLIKAAVENHAEGNILVPHGKFPSLEYVEFSAHPAAVDYFEYGPSFLNRYLPFWLSSLLNRTKIMLLPLMTLAFPLIKMAPPIYRWQIRARIYRWYDLLREVDQKNSEHSQESIARHLASLNKMQEELKEVNVPLSYMEEFYNLHMHIELVKRHLQAEAVLLKEKENTADS